MALSVALFPPVGEGTGYVLLFLLVVQVCALVASVEC